MTNIILTGFMGTGKTTVGRLLAAQLGYRFVDTDEMITARTGQPVAHIFEEEGEVAFRQYEAEAAQALADEDEVVIATGGRLMLDADNAARLSENGRVFCLVADAAEIAARLARDGAVRPLLAGADPTARIQTLLTERAAGYGRFTPIDTNHKSPEQVVQAVMRQLNQPVQLTVTHPTGQYPILIGHQLLPQLPQLAQITGPIIILTDSQVGPLYARQCDPQATVVTIPAGEQHKTLETVRQVYDWMLTLGVGREATVVALGGGVVGDIAGFVAATYMRGLDFVQCPTSLLAMVDASLGGKTGVDMPQGKNLVGAFKQPTAVVVDLDTLTTLPPGEWAAGMAEVVKHGLIAAPALWAKLETGGAEIQVENAPYLVTEAIKVKQEIVQQDPFEKGRRAVLNLGHTFAHAIEQVSAYAVRHGEAVAMGLVAAAHLSAQLDYCDPSLPTRIETLLARLNLPTRIPHDLDGELLFAAMGHDKKKQAGQLRFILLREVGEVFIAPDVPDTAVWQTLQAVRATPPSLPGEEEGNDDD